MISAKNNWSHFTFLKLQFTMKYFFTICIAFLVLTSCSTLHSTTIIKPMDSFILGNNKHNSFKVKLTNISKNDIEIHKAPIDGGQHSFEVVKPNALVSLKVESNTALFIQNKSNDTAFVKLKVTGDLGLSMGYKN